MSAQPEKPEPYVVRIERGGTEIARVTQSADGAPSFQGTPLPVEAAFRLCGVLLAVYILTMEDGTRPN